MRCKFVVYYFCIFIVANMNPVFAQMYNNTVAKESYEIVIPFQYDSLSNFSEGLAAFKSYKRWGFIDKTNNEVIPCVWKKAEPFSEGLAAVKNYKDEWGFIDKTNNEVIPCVWKKAKPFSEGLAAVKNYKDEWGFIDKTGKVVIPCKWISTFWFSEGVCTVTKKRFQQFLIDKNGNKIKMVNRKLILPISEGLAPVIDSGYFGAELGFIDNKGNAIITPNNKWKGISLFHEGLANMMNKEEKYGYIDKTGHEVIPYRWKMASDFSEGLAAVKNDKDAWGYIDKTGYKAIPFIWKNAYPFCDSIAVVQDSNGKWGAIRYTPRPPRRMALLIGNWEYLKYKKSLRSPRKDVEEMYETLMQIGFEKPVVAMNVSKRAMKDSICVFMEKAATADVAVVYYSGHGLQYNQKNYLLPDDYEQFEYDPKNEIAIGRELNDRCIIGQDIIARLDELECNNKFLVMDACRDHSFGGRKGASPEKFAKMESKNGTCIVYATAEGKEAYDGGDGENSFFTRALLEGLKKPEITFQDLFDFVEKQVRLESAKYKYNVQIPVVFGIEPVKNFIFNNKQ